MNSLQHSYQGLTLLLALNWDRIMMSGVMALGIAGGAYLMTL